MKPQIQSYHQEILSAIRQRASSPEPQAGNKYMGTQKPLYSITVPATRKIARAWVAQHRDLTPEDYTALLDALAQGETSNEVGFVGELLSLMPKLRQTLDPARLDRWLEGTEGWGEIDSICQGKFTAQETLTQWGVWKKLLTAFSKSPQISKRRASLVLLTRPLRESDDARLYTLALANVERLKGEKDVLITKAVSWVLREMVKHHRVALEAYLAENEATLPRIAVRETRVKLKTGRKTQAAGHRKQGTSRKA
ncbi:MAG: DNA alkylation repair protein [Anaerolineae bacterium]